MSCFGENTDTIAVGRKVYLTRLQVNGRVVSTHGHFSMVVVTESFDPEDHGNLLHVANSNLQPGF